MGTGRRIGEIPERGDPGQQHLQMISAHVSAYITHVRTQLKQTIPKAIVHCLVSFCTLPLAFIVKLQNVQFTADNTFSTATVTSLCADVLKATGGKLCCAKYSVKCCSADCNMRMCAQHAWCGVLWITIGTLRLLAGDASQEAAARQVAC